MGNHDSHADDKNFVQIQPAHLTLSSTDSDTGAATKEKKPRRTFWLGVLIGGLTGLALLVILLLPDHIDTPEAPEVVGIESSGSIQAQQNKPESSPWQEAQTGKQRSAAQDVLEKLLDHQFQLEEIAVAQWAGEEFDRANALAHEGDEHYRNREFIEALNSYEAGLELMEQLLARKGQAMSDAIASGNAAIEAGDSAAATDAFELAMAIDPDQPDALQGLKRAQVLDQVRQMLAEAEKLEESGNINEALALLQQVSAIDPAEGSASQSIARLQALLDKREFNRQMTAGYQALGRKEYGVAMDAFRAASRLDPQATEAREALRQAQNEKNLVAISKHIEKAERFRQQEAWLQVLREYDQALEIDSNLLVVLQKREEAETRAKLDAALEDAIKRPERLTSDAVWQAAQVVYRRAASIDDPGPRLKRQIAALEQSLQDAITPVMVTFSSDNLSQVILHKVARLGSFETRQIELKPGNYVIVASREGYRDVRKEFTVAPRSQSMHMAIQCEEPI